ncbi:MAG TPA: ferric aerobactin receptor [Hyphomonadaceae bacterium]|nr:ferric aerobactin receptor [Hyphomonadaceae bacterium]
MPYRLMRPISLLILSGGAFLGSAAAQETARGPDQELIGDTITVTATRTQRSLDDLAQQVTILTSADIAREVAFDPNLTTILGRLVPGLSPPQGDGRTEDFTIRGRPVFLLIDGVPQNSNSGFGTEFFAIDPAAIERIEVVRGASAIFGEGATGGIIHIITRRLRDEAGAEGNANATLRLQPSTIGQRGPSYRLSTLSSGRTGSLSGLVSVAVDEDQGFFDAAGGLIPPDGSSNFNRQINILGKIGYDLDENQKLTASFNFLNNNFDSPFISDPSANLPPIGAIARALNVGDIAFDDPPRQRVVNVTGAYEHADLFGSKLSAQFFYRTTDLAQVPSDISGAPFLVFFPTAPAIFQTTLDAREIGGRLLIETPVVDGLTLAYGADISFDDLEGPFNSIDEDLFDNDQSAVVIANPTQIPPFTQRNIAGFVQAEWEALANLRLSGGVRFEAIRLDVEDFTASPFTNPGAFPEDLLGGQVSTSDFVFNFGIVYDVTERLALVYNFSQGFSLPGVGFTLGLGSFGDVADDSDGGFALKAQEVTNFDGAVRYRGDRLSLTAAGFFNFSRVGTTFALNPVSGFLEPVIAPQRNFGVEFDGEWRPIDSLRVGGSLTWVDGNFDIGDDGDFQALSSVVAPPIQLRGFIAHQTTPKWRNRVSILSVRRRDRAFADGTDALPVESYTTIDIASDYRFRNIVFSFGIQNILDNQFIPASSQTETIDTTRFAGAGRVFTFGISSSF